MTRGFYEQIGVQPDADLDEVKASYGRAVAHLLKRREATVTSGGDTSALDLARAQLDEAWEVLSDPARRRRYDAMLAVAGDGLSPEDYEGLWNRVAGAMIHPAVAAAARIVDAGTELALSPLPEPPRPAPGRATAPPADALPADAPAPRPQVQASAARPTPEPPPDTALLAGERPRVPEPPPTAPQVNEPPPPTSPTVVPMPTSAADVDQLVDQHGYSGALLAAAREQKGVSIEEMSQTTRISERYLQAVEAEDFGALPPAPAFVRGYVREMARMLGLDVERVVAGYMRRFSADG